MATAHRWVPYLVDGRPSEAVKRATDLASGAYAIRRKDSHGVVYVGESNLGHMWRTLARHFQAPATFTATKKPGGANAFATDQPGDYEVTWQTTSRGKRAKGHGDAKAMALQARWIKKFRKAGNRLHNRDDGMANAEVERDYREHRAKQDAEEADRPWYENPKRIDKRGSLRCERVPARGRPRIRVTNPEGTLTELGRLTSLTFVPPAAAGSFFLEMLWTLAAAPILAFDAAKRLHIVYVAGAPVRPSTPAELREYKRAHWGATSAGKVRDGGVAVPPWKVLGEGFTITYTTKKGTDAAPVDYVHRWGEGSSKRCVPPRIVRHECRGGCAKSCAAAGMLSLSGGSYTVSERGIVG